MALRTQAARAQAHVTCVGDSITAGVGATSAAAAYPEVLQRLLGPTFAVENDGHSGATLMKAAKPSYWSTPEYERSTEWATAGGDVVILLGTNDSWPVNWSNHASFLGDCKALVQHYRELPGRPRVWLSLIPPCCGNGGRTIAEEVVPLLKICAMETGTSSIDLFGALQRHPHFFVDGVHPDDDGAALIAKTVHDALRKPGPEASRRGVPMAMAGAAFFGICAFVGRRLRRKRR